MMGTLKDRENDFLKGEIVLNLLKTIDDGNVFLSTVCTAIDLFSAEFDVSTNDVLNLINKTVRSANGEDEND